MDNYEIGIPIYSVDEMRRIAEVFAGMVSESSEQFFGCIVAIDVWVCANRKPYKKETKNQRKYRNKKNLWGIAVLAGCDARGKSIMLSCNGSGSANDALAWRWSRIKTEVLSLYDGTFPSLLPPNYFFTGDEAFVCERQFIVPLGGNGIGESEDAFNFHLSARWQVVERAFGMLTRRWVVGTNK